jgi:hypothetical protein
MTQYEGQIPIEIQAQTQKLVEDSITPLARRTGEAARLPLPPNPYANTWVYLQEMNTPPALPEYCRSITVHAPDGTPYRLCVCPDLKVPITSCSESVPATGGASNQQTRMWISLLIFIVAIILLCILGYYWCNN